MNYYKFINNKIKIYLESGNTIEGILSDYSDGFLEVILSPEIFYISDEKIDFISILKNNYISKDKIFKNKVEKKITSIPKAEEDLSERLVKIKGRDNKDSPYTFRGVKLPESIEEVWDRVNSGDLDSKSNLPQDLLESRDGVRYNRPDANYEVNFEANIGGTSNGNSSQ